MRRLAAALGLVCMAVALAGAPASAQEGDQVSPAPRSALVGQQFPLTIEVVAPAGADVEIDTGNASWGAVEVVGVRLLETAPAGDDTTRHTFVVTAAAFAVGEVAFTPTVTIIDGGAATTHTLEAGAVEVLPTLREGDPLELTPLSPAQPVGGGQSPLLVPAIVVGAIFGAALLAGIIFLVARRLLRRWRAGQLQEPDSRPMPMPNLDSVEQWLLTDPVAAYRAIAAMVRSRLASHYGFPARALTTMELQQRMEAAGVDRWQARLVGGLLEECDAVIYAGYRPASERRAADLTMAREVLEGGA